MIAYHNRQELKDRVLAIITEHEQADRIISGTYAKFGKSDEFAGGCAVGCTLESIRRIEGLTEIEHSEHALYERYLGVPAYLARLEDSIFEGLSGADQLTWPRRFAEAIRPGSDLSMVRPKFLRWLLADPKGGVQSGVARREAIRPSVDAVIVLFDQWIQTGEKPPSAAWRDARSAAYAAYAADAAYAAADADAAAYADAAADAAAAAYAAADARLGARLAERQRQADFLIELLKAA